MVKLSRARWYERLGYVPRNGQAALDAAVDGGKRFAAMFAFPQAGKSFGAAHHASFDLLKPDWHIWIVGAKYEFGAKEFGYIWRDLGSVLFEGKTILQRATRRHFDVRGGNMQIELPWDSWVRVVSADNPDSLRMEQLDCVILAEASALDADVYQRYLFARVELRKGKVLVPTTPKGYNWVYEAFRVPSLTHTNFTYGPWMGHARQRIGGEPNPKYDPLYWSAVVSAVPDYGDILEPGVHSVEAVDRGRRLLPRQVFAEQFGGDFASYAGLIYQYDPRLHECEPFPVPDDWTHVVGYDHGAREENPTAIMFGSYAPDGTLYWWAEIYLGGNYSAGEYANMIRRTLGHTKSPSAIVVDASARQVRVELARVGMTTTIPHDKQIEARITRVTSLMREGKWKVMRGRCPNWVQEVMAWEWDEDNPGKPRPKQRCHALDASGYAALATVGLPQEAERDPDTILGEDSRTERIWKPVRKMWREAEEREAEANETRTLFENPFVEETLEPQEYVFDA